MTAPAEVGRARRIHHVITMRVENRSGVLVRVAGLFARRGFNIFSLAVAPTHDERFSRIVAVVDVESSPLQQILDQLDKLVNVVEISELDPSNAFQAELLLATVTVSETSGDELESLAGAFGAQVVDADEERATVMCAAAPDALDVFEAELARFGILELQRTGRIALAKLS